MGVCDGSEWFAPVCHILRSIINLSLAIFQIFFFRLLVDDDDDPGEINGLGHHVIQLTGGKNVTKPTSRHVSDGNCNSKTNCRAGKGSQPLLSCLRAIPSPH